MLKKVIAIIAILLLVGILLSYFLGEFQLGLSKVKKIDEEYGVSMSEYPLSFAEVNQIPLTVNDITLMLDELRTLRENSKDSALLQFLDFRISLLEAEMQYKLALALGKKGDVSDGFGCRDEPVIIEAAAYKNQSAQVGYRAVNHLTGFLTKYPRQAEIAGVPESWPVFLNASFQEIEKNAGGTIRFIKRVCSEKEAG